MPSLTITLSPGNAQRVAEAFDSFLILDHPTTVDDVKAYLITQLKEIVRNHERRAARAAADAGIVDVDPT